MTAWIDYVLARAPELWLRTLEHLMLTGLSTVGAVLIGVPVGLVAFYRPRVRSILLSSIGVLQTIPSLAMLALLLVLFGQIGVLPALTALTLYALLPVVRNTVVGLDGVGDDIGEAAKGLGMTARQELVIVRFPLALPVLTAGVRTAAVIGVGIATLSAFIGAGGLGQFINRGLALSDTRLIVLGAVPAGILALVVDASIAGLAWASDPREHRTGGGAMRRSIRWAAVVFPLVLLLTPTVAVLTVDRGDDRAGVRICSKNFTEQILLGEIMAQLVESRTDLSVDRRFGLGGTIICHNALTAGEVDLYPEYTGTALTAILGGDVQSEAGSDPDDVYETVQEAYLDRFDLQWLAPFGFDNSYVLLARRQLADSLGWSVVSDVAPRAPELSVGFTAEFAERPDGYPGFSERYGFAFGDTRDLDPSILYRAVADGQVDLAFGFATDGRIDSYDLAVLEDDRSFFPPYEAAPVVRVSTLRAYPELGRALGLLGDALPDSTMRRLNREVDEGVGTSPEVARDFLASRSLVGSQSRPSASSTLPVLPR